MSDDGNQQDDLDVDKKANQLVRLMLACQQTGIPLKRDDINTHITDLSSRTLPAVIARANTLLKGQSFIVDFNERYIRHGDQGTTETCQRTAIKSRSLHSHFNTLSRTTVLQLTINLCKGSNGSAAVTALQASNDHPYIPLREPETTAILCTLETLGSVRV